MTRTRYRPALSELVTGDVRVLHDPLSERDAGVRVAFTDRRGGVSAEPYDTLNLAARVGDEPSDVEVNRARVADACGFTLEALALARQVHGRDIIEVTRGQTGVIGEADVLVTREPGPVIGILTADCTPVIVAGERGLAVAHAGWRGLVAGAVEAAAESVGGTSAWIGPAIHACCYEVGPEVVEAFERAGLPVADDRHVDPGRAAAFAARRAGVRQIAATTDCTSCDRRYFSYRRDGTTGRQGAFAWMTG